MDSDSEVADSVMTDPDYVLEVSEGSEDDSPCEGSSVATTPRLSGARRAARAHHHTLPGRTSVQRRPGRPPGSRASSTRGRGMMSGEDDNASQTPRVIRRARGQRERGPTVLSDEDLARCQKFQEERVQDLKRKIKNFDLTKSHQVLEISVERDPSMLFDLLADTEVRDGSQLPRVDGQPQWCVCCKCREMPTDIEKVCCRQPPDNCVSSLPHMDSFVLQSGVLRLARRMWNDSMALVDERTPGESHKEYRHAAYRQYILWKYGQLGPGHRVVIPSCCVWRIRNTYPDPNGVYRGFIPSRHGMAED